MNSRIERIRKLLAMGNDSRGSDAESELALAMATRLMAKWNIDDLDLFAEEAGLENLGDLEKRRVYESRRIAYWRTMLMSTLARFCHCTGAIAAGSGLIVYGHKANLDKFDLLWELICPQIESWTKAQCSGLGRTYARSYRLGIINTLQGKLNTSERELIAERSESEQTALVTVSDKIRAEVDEFANLRGEYKASASRWSHEAYQRGRSDGKHIQTERSSRLALT